MSGGNKAKTRITTLDFSEKALAFFRDLLGRMSCNTSLERREVKESLLILKDHLLHPQEWSRLMSRQSSKGSRSLAWINKELLTQI